MPLKLNSLFSCVTFDNLLNLSVPQVRLCTLEIFLELLQDEAS